jgi:hypothetical protein
MLLNGVVGLLALAVAVAVIGSFLRRLRSGRGLIQPLSNIAGLYGRFLVLYLLLAVFSVRDGVFGGPRGSVCVDTGYPAGSGGGSVSGVVARQGASIGGSGDVRACALHPSVGQWTLFLLTKLPGLILWGCVLLLIWRLLTMATRHGPFTAQSASVMRQLGWVVVAGSMLAAALGAVGADLLTRMLMTPATYDVRGVLLHVLLVAPLEALFPVPALTGAALITFGRITTVGTAMDEELKATV